ncbi:MAG: RnfABCDGE type electron transport complex subunit B [Clostridia bacterium]|nr:RnfABCDGE type electron transport complex subunit B [Clostridia bacterium]
MNAIIIPILLVVAIGLVLGFALAFASKFMAVKVDEKQEKIRECLPGANCGACGFSGCDGYAAAIAEGKAEPNKCAPGGKTTADALAKLLGVTIEDNPKVAFVACSRNCETAKKVFKYSGISSCAAESLVNKGEYACEFACLGLGDCVKACPFGAITLKAGKPVICEDICTGCGKCATVCPKSVINIVPKASKVKVGCSNKLKGPKVVKDCSVSCIGCGLCERACESDAIKVIDNLAHIDYSKCIACGKCKDACKRNVII